MATCFLLKVGVWGRASSHFLAGLGYRVDLLARLGLVTWSCRLSFCERLGPTALLSAQRVPNSLRSFLILASQIWFREVK